MNYLGHFFLAQNDQDYLVGNFIADCVKGNRYLDYPARISDGILMHRNIDFFTDNHPQVRKSRQRLFPRYKHYSSVIIDMYYDHFLAINWKDYSDVSLEDFSSSIYENIEPYTDILPERSKYIFHYMKKGNWLTRYATIEGLNKSFHGLSERAKFRSDMEHATKDLQLNFGFFENEFRLFIQDAMKKFLYPAD